MITVDFDAPAPDATVAPGVIPVTFHASDDTGAPITRGQLDYRRASTDPWLQAPDRTIMGAGPFTWQFDASTLADGPLTFHGTAYSANGSKATNLTVTLKADPPPPVAAFAVHRDNANFMVLDAMSSTGDALSCAWEVDGAPLTDMSPTPRVQRPVGIHTVKLTVTDSKGRMSVAGPVAQPWTWDVLSWTAQSDTANGPENPGGGENLPEIDWIKAPDAAFRTAEVINTAARDSLPAVYGCRPQLDGTCIFEVHQGDHPGTTGGDRAGMGWNQAYSLPDGVTNAKANVMGGKPLEVRFVRYGVMFLPETWLKADGSLIDTRSFRNNEAEFHGPAGGGSTLKVGPSDANGDKSCVELTPIVGDPPAGYKPLPSNKIGITPIAPGTWLRYLLEVYPTTLENGGYVRIRRFDPSSPAADTDGYVCVTATVKSYRRTDDGLWYVQDVQPIADPANPDYGKVYAPVTKMVKQADGTLAPEPLNVAFQHYRQKMFSTTSGRYGEPIPPTSIRFEAPRIGPTRESVLA